MSVYGSNPRPGAGVIGGILGTGGIATGGGVIVAGNDSPDQSTTTGEALPATGPGVAQIATVGLGIVLLGLILVAAAALILRHGWRPGQDVTSR